MKKLKLLIIPLLIVMLLTFGMNSFASLHSKWSSGDLIYYDGTTNIFAIKNGTDGLFVYDDIKLTFGDDSDATIEYDEDGTDKFIFTCSNGFTFTGDWGFTGDVLMATTSKIQFHDTGLYINASGNGAMVISSDGTLAVGATTSYTLTSPAVKFIATTSVVHEYDAASYVTQTVTDAGAVKVAVIGDSAGAYEIETDDGAIILDAAATITLDAGTGNVETADIVDITDTTDASSLTAGALIVDGGIACAKQLFVGDDIDMSVSGTGVYELTLKDTVADALSIVGGSTDMMVFKTDTDQITITPEVLFLDDIDLSTSGTGVYDLTLKTNMGDALSITDGTDIIVFDTTTGTPQVTITPITNIVGILNADNTTDASAIGTAAVVVDGGISCAKKIWVGDDIDLSNGGTGVYDLILKTNVADALSIKDSVADIIVFETTTGTPVVTITPITTITGALTLNGGAVIADDQTVAYGTGSDVTESWNNTRGALVIAPSGHFVSPEGISDRFRLVWVAGQRGKPGINADIQEAAESTRKVTDNDFEVAGTAGSSDDITFYAEGGITMETDGTDGNGVLITPHVDNNQSAWHEVTWGTDKEVRWEAHIKTGAAITTCIIYAGLKLTATDVVITDANQVFFRYEDAINDGEWQAVSSIADSDDSHDTNVAVAINTEYHLVIEIDSSRVAKFYINGSLVETSAALTDAVDFIPYVSIEEDGASAAMTLYVRGQAISRKY